jgi:hypothetical protein
VADREHHLRQPAACRPHHHLRPEGIAMKIQKSGTGIRFSIIVMALIVAASALFVVGCGPQTPEVAVRNFLKARDTDNWKQFLDSILPANVRSMTPADEVYYRDTFLKQGSKSLIFNPAQLQMKTVTRGDNAVVTLVAGKLVAKNSQTKEDVPLDLKTGEYKVTDPQTGKVIVQKLSSEEKASIKELTVYNCKYYKGRWYVDYSLQRPTQSTLQ